MIRALLLLVIVSHSLLLISCDDNEFAEFDEFSADDIASAVPQQKPTIRPAAPVASEPTTFKQSQADRITHESEDDPKKGQNLETKSDHPFGDDQLKKPDLKLVNAPSFRQFKLESYYVEILFLLATLLYLVNFFVGSAKNQQLAQGWYEKSRELLRQQFSLVGGAPTLTETSGTQKRDEELEAYLASLKKQRGLIKASESLFTIWNSGRIGMEGLLIEINLLKRQDLFSMALNLMKASRDTLTFRVSLGNEGYENFVFCVAHRSQASKLVRDMVDINTFCPKRKPMSQCGHDVDKLVVMSELTDVQTFVFDPKTIRFLKKYEKAFNYIHITDHFSTDRSEDISAMQKLGNTKRIATFSFAFPQSAEESNEYILFSLGLLDRLRRFKLARDSKQKSEKNRQKITDYLQKAAFNLKHEAAQAKKEELRRLEKERIYNEDDPEKQRRWEKKEAKREQKRNKMRVKQLRVKSM